MIRLFREVWRWWHSLRRWEHPQADAPYGFVTGKGWGYPAPYTDKTGRWGR